MALHVFLFVLLLVACLLLLLVLLWRLDWFNRRPSSSWGEAKRSTMQHPLPRQGEGQHLCLCVPGAR